MLWRLEAADVCICQCVAVCCCCVEASSRPAEGAAGVSRSSFKLQSVLIRNNPLSLSSHLTGLLHASLSSRKLYKSEDGHLLKGTEAAEDTDAAFIFIRLTKVYLTCSDWTRSWILPESG